MLRLVFLLLLLVQGCASVPNPDPRDPIESWNRGVFSFNEGADRWVLKPVASVYRDVTPGWLRKGVNNFFGNLTDVWSIVNNALQLRGQDTGDSIGRVMVNSTIGVLGLFDVASDLNIERHPANFGLTLGRWGVPAGPYIVIPLLGPSSVREIAGSPIDNAGNIVGNLPDEGVRTAATVLSAVNTRSLYLEAGTLVDDAALDKYSFLRDAYLQRRRNQVYDGNPPDEEAPATTPP